MSLKNIMLNEAIQSQRRQVLYDSPCMWYLKWSKTKRQKSTTVAARALREREKLNYCFMDVDLQFCKMKSFEEGWWLHNNMYILNTIILFKWLR